MLLGKMLVDKMAEHKISVYGIPVDKMSTVKMLFAFSC
jgi:hypothetical protein